MFFVVYFDDQNEFDYFRSIKLSNLYRLETFLLRNAIDLIEAGLITDETLQPANQQVDR